MILDSNTTDHDGLVRNFAATLVRWKGRGLTKLAVVIF